jgi:hypothetical protein
MSPTSYQTAPPRVQVRLTIYIIYMALSRSYARDAAAESGSCTEQIDFPGATGCVNIDEGEKCESNDEKDDE